MDTVRDNANTAQNLLNRSPQELSQPEMSSSFELTTPTQGQTAYQVRQHYQSPRYSSGNLDTNDIATMSAAALREMLTRSRRSNWHNSQSCDLLKRKLKNVRQSREELIHNNQKLLREYEDMLQGRQELIRDHQQLRREHRNLRHDHQELRRQQQREHQRDRRDIYREYQELKQEYQELLCVHDEEKQDRTALKVENGKLRNMLEQERERFEKDKNDLEFNVERTKSRYEYIIENVIPPYAQNNGLVYDDENRSTIEAVLQPLKQDAFCAKALQRQTDNPPNQLQTSQAEMDTLRRQVQELQKEMLAKVEKVQTVSDERFAQDFHALSAHIKSLSRSIRLNPDLNIIAVLEPGALTVGAEVSHWKIRANQKYYIEAWIWSVLLDMVFTTPFTVFGNSALPYANAWKLLYCHSRKGGLPVATTSSEAYRCTVTSELVRLLGRETVTQGHREAYLRDRQRAKNMAKGVLECRDEVANTIGTKLTTISMMVDVSQIPAIIDRAFALALEMSLQRCRIQLTCPAIGAAFDGASMSAMADLDGDDVADGMVAFIVNPGLTKWGDADGKMLDQHYDIVPSLVQLESVMVKRECIWD